jgi:hypothetical protein
MVVMYNLSFISAIISDAFVHKTGDQNEVARNIVATFNTFLNPFFCYCGHKRSSVFIDFLSFFFNSGALPVLIAVNKYLRSTSKYSFALLQNGRV